MTYDAALCLTRRAWPATLISLVASWYWGLAVSTTVMTSILLFLSLFRLILNHSMFFWELDLSRFWRKRKYESSSEESGTLCSIVGYRDENDDYTKNQLLRRRRVLLLLQVLPLPPFMVSNAKRMACIHMYRKSLQYKVSGHFFMSYQFFAWRPNL